MSVSGKIAIAASGGVLAWLLVWSVAAEFDLRVGVPRSQRLGMIDPRDTHPRSFRYRQPHRLSGISFVSAESGGEALQLPTGLPRAFQIRIVSGSTEVASQQVLASELIASNWHEPHRSCFFYPTAKLRTGDSYMLEITPVAPGERTDPLQVVLEFIDYD